MLEEQKYAVITAIYNGNTYKSLPMLMKDNSPDLQVILDLSDNGTNKIDILKFPLQDNSFVIFSKMQIDNTLFIVKIHDSYEDAMKDNNSNINLIKS